MHVDRRFLIRQRATSTFRTLPLPLGVRHARTPSTPQGQALTDLNNRVNEVSYEFNKYKKDNN